MQQGDYSSYYQFPNFQNPNPNLNPNPNANPNPIDHNQSSSFASAPPFSSSYAPSDYSAYPQSYPPYSSNPDPAPYAPPVNSQSSFNPTPPPPPPTQPPVFPTYDSHGSAATAYQQQPAAQQSYFPPFDHHQTAASYAPPPPQPPAAASNLIPGSGAPYSLGYSGSLNSIGGLTAPSAFDNPYENSPKFDQGVGYFDDKYGVYNRGRSELASDPYGKRPEGGRYEMGRDDGYGDGVYAYQGGKVEPYGARGTAPKSSTSAMFDDYGRAINIPSSKDSSLGSGAGFGSPKIVRAVPKMETQEDVKSGVQKFRVKLLAESGGQSTIDVLCQIGLDGIKMLDPNTSRTLRIYPLENITRCDKMDSSTFAFWSKSTVDVEPRRIRLQSNSYTTNTLLDTVTAATVQLKEMGGRSKPSDLSKASEQTAEKKKGFGEWINFVKPPNEEKDHWVPDEAVTKCTSCGTDFNAFIRKHHCRNCGDIFCDKCTHGRIALTAEESAQPVRVCDRCLAEVTQRLTNSKEAASKPAALHSHEDLARKLQEEMEKNRKSSSGTKSDGSGKRMREVACPTCTVHLQVQVPSSGSETIECGVCQHPFLVSAH